MWGLLFFSLYFDLYPDLILVPGAVDRLRKHIPGLGLLWYFLPQWEGIGHLSWMMVGVLCFKSDICFGVMVFATF